MVGCTCHLFAPGPPGNGAVRSLYLFLKTRQHRHWCSSRYQTATLWNGRYTHKLADMSTLLDFDRTNSTIILYTHRDVLMAFRLRIETQTIVSHRETRSTWSYELDLWRHGCRPSLAVSEACKLSSDLHFLWRRKLACEGSCDPSPSCQVLVF